MKGFYLAIGKQGSGKTLFITKHLIDELKTEPKKVFSNYTLFGIEYQHITFDEDIEKKRYKDVHAIDIMKILDEDESYFDNSIILLDEIHIYFDSRDFMRKNIRHIQTFFSQLRKRNILLLATTQYILNLDIRIRRQALAVFQMKQIKDDVFQADTYEIDGYYTDFVRSDLFNLSSYYKYYNTNEIIT